MTEVVRGIANDIGVKPKAATGRRHTKTLSIGSSPAFSGLSPIGDHSSRSKRRASLAVPVNGGTPSADHVIAYHGPELMIKIDYGKSMYDVGKDFMNHAFSRFGYIDMMCGPWAPEPNNEESVAPWNPPSWMMILRDNVAFELDENRLHHRVRADPLVGSPGLNVKRNYNASGATRAFDRALNETEDAFIYPPVFSDNQSLHVKGFEVAKVWSKSDPAAYGNTPGKWLEFYNDFVNIDPLKKWDHKSEHERPPAIFWRTSVADRGQDGISHPPAIFWRTLVADRGQDGISHPPRYFDLACQYAFKNVARARGLNTSEFLTNSWCPTHVAEFLRRVQCVVWQRRLVVALQPENTNRLLCLAPENVEEGDLICILMGCSVPVVLREQDARSTAHPNDKYFPRSGILNGANGAGD